MKTTLMSALLAAAIAARLFAQTTDDPFDYSAVRQNLQETGIPSVGKVEELAKAAEDLYSTGRWKEAAEALERYAKAANHLSNLINYGNEPYYSASYDDRKDFSRSELSVLVGFEKTVNTYRRRRNEAMVKQGICYLRLGDHENAIVLLTRALDLIGIDDVDLWQIARKRLYSILGIE